jgi:hypothetical protein
MTRYALPFLLALMSVFFLIPSCSTVTPYIKPISSCVGKTVAAGDVNEAFDDLLTQNWGDLAAEGVRLGYDVLACIISSIETQAPGLKPAAAEFRQLHSVEFRAAGGSACLDKASQKVGASETTASEARPPETLAQARHLTLAACDRACGARLTGMPVESGTACSCWRADRKDWRNSRWVPLREAPGAGMVAAR